MAKIAYNACHGGFSLSDAAIRRYAELKGLELHPEEIVRGLFVWWTVPPDQRSDILRDEDWYSASQEQRAASNALRKKIVIEDRDLERNDPVLIQVIEELGDKANGPFARLRIEELAAGTKYRIDEYDGLETVNTSGDYEWSIA